MRHARILKSLTCLTICAGAIGCSSTPAAPARAHAELTREAQLMQDEAIFAVGDSLGARLVRSPQHETLDSPVFARRTPMGFQAADALGATALSSRPALAGVVDDE
ncbi:MAG: hypothetical protein ACF8QF_07900 [Phycisphaerales bacterium]